MTTTSRKSKTKIPTDTSNDESQVVATDGLDHPLYKDIDFTSKSNPIPCDVGNEAFLPYWEKDENGIVYGVDKYKVASIAGCGDFWTCRISDEKGNESYQIEPNVDVFFSEKDAEKKINAIKKTEDVKKLSKWKRKNIENVGK